MLIISTPQNSVPPSAIGWKAQNPAPWGLLIGWAGSYVNERAVPIGWDSAACALWLAARSLCADPTRWRGLRGKSAGRPIESEALLFVEVGDVGWGRCSLKSTKDQKQRAQWHNEGHRRAPENMSGIVEVFVPPAAKNQSDLLQQRQPPLQENII